MQLSALKAQFRTLADDAEVPYLWSDADLTGWFNEAQREAAIRKKLIFEKTDQSICRIDATTSAGSVYALNPLLFELVYVSITDASGTVYQLSIKDRVEMDRISPDWRTTTQRPCNVIHYDQTLELASILDDDYTVNLEGYRLPKCDMEKDKDEPEIHEIHHIRLVDWVLHKAYEVPDSEKLNPEKSARSLDKFEQYFGFRPDANMRRDENAVRPHRNKAHW